MADAPRAGPAAVGRGARGTSIGRVTLRNFGGHADLGIGLGRIAVLTGPTGSGKSAVLDALGLLRSALAGDALALRGGGGGGDRPASVGVEGRKEIEAGAGVGPPAVGTEFSCTVEFDGRLRRPGLDAAVSMALGSAPGGAGTLRLEHSHGGGGTAVRCAGVPGGVPVEARDGGSEGLAPRVRADLAGHPAEGAFRAMFGGGEYFGSLLDDLWRVPLSRAVVPGVLRHCSAAAAAAGTAPREGAQAGASSLLGRAARDGRVRGRMSGMAEEIGIGRVVEGYMSAEGGGSGMAGPDSGAGGLACMLAALVCSPRGSVVAIEEPEAHLDPAAQARLVGVIVRQVVEDGKQVVFTTHSDHLLYPLLAYVKKEGCPLECGDVSMHYFEADETGGPAGAERLDINEHGQIKGGLRGFWDADMKAMGELLG